MDDRTYNVRLDATKIINPFMIDLKGCGSFQLYPGKEYFFTNAPLKFIEYLAQLAMMNVTYKITNERKGCFYSIDLSKYGDRDPLNIISKYRTTVIDPKKEVKEEEKVVVLSSTDVAPREDESSNDEVELNKMIAEDLKKEQEVAIVPENLPIADETNIEDNPEAKEEPVEAGKIKVYTETELSRLGKVKLLEISNALGLDYSDINTKKEIRDGILEAQSK